MKVQSALKGHKRNCVFFWSAGAGSLQTCARCRNHNSKIIMKGHKPNCPYLDCNYSKCQITKKGQKITVEAKVENESESEEIPQKTASKAVDSQPNEIMTNSECVFGF